MESVQDDIFRGYGIEVQLNKAEDFLKVAETLTRIGVAARNENRLYQTCHILHKRGRYAIMHFKEMMALDGNETNYSADDARRRNKIVQLLEQWRLVTSLTPMPSSESDVGKIKVIPHRDKHLWVLVKKYTIGKRK